MRRYIKEPFPALSHVVGVVLSILALMTLLDAAGNNDRALAGSAIFGGSLILLYLASALTHGVHCSPKTASRFEQLDHAAIFLLIAGTYTPVCLLIIKGSLGWMMLSVEWLLAFAGIYSVFYGNQKSKRTQVVTYLLMGWLFLFAINSIFHNLPNSLSAWLIGGGLFYSIGAIFFLTNWPTLWRGYFNAHDLWHVFVLGGSTCHFLLIRYYLETMA